MVVRPLLEAGKLVHVLGGALQIESRVAVVYPEREFIPAQVRAFVDAVVAWAPGELEKGLPACPKSEPVGKKRAPGKRRKAG